MADHRLYLVTAAMEAMVMVTVEVVVMVMMRPPYLPPTQSQNSNMFASSMPNLVTSSLLVESATKCLATWAASLAESRNQLLQVVALVMVSWRGGEVRFIPSLYILLFFLW